MTKLIEDLSYTRDRGFALVIPYPPIYWKRPSQGVNGMRFDEQAQLKSTLIPFFIKAMGKNKPFDGPIQVIIQAWFKLPKKHKKIYSPTFKDTKGDADNIAKFYLDTINDTKRVWHDDAQVADLRVIKRYMPNIDNSIDPYVYIIVEKLWTIGEENEDTNVKRTHANIRKTNTHK